MKNLKAQTVCRLRNRFDEVDSKKYIHVSERIYFNIMHAKQKVLYGLENYIKLSLSIRLSR